VRSCSPAHIDTVFPAGTEVAPQTTGTRLAAPGACDKRCRRSPACLPSPPPCSKHLSRCPAQSFSSATSAKEGARAICADCANLYQRSPWREPHRCSHRAGRRGPRSRCHRSSGQPALSRDDNRARGALLDRCRVAQSDCPPQSRHRCAHRGGAATREPHHAECRNHRGGAALSMRFLSRRARVSISAPLPPRSWCAWKSRCIAQSKMRFLSANAAATEVRKRRPNVQAAFTIDRIGDRPRGPAGSRGEWPNPLR